MSKIHLICGPVGAGKTTFAAALCRNMSAVHFSIDHWMTCLFTPDLTGDIEYSWAMTRIERMESLIWSQVVQLMALDVDAVLDLGLLQQEHRAKFYALAQQRGFDICLHFINADKEVRWRRVMGRNDEKGESFTMNVDRSMFDFCEALFESPVGDELDSAIIHEA